MLQRKIFMKSIITLIIYHTTGILFTSQSFRVQELILYIIIKVEYLRLILYSDKLLMWMPDSYFLQKKKTESKINRGKKKESCPFILQFKKYPQNQRVWIKQGFLFLIFFLHSVSFKVSKRNFCYIPAMMAAD